MDVKNLIVKDSKYLKNLQLPIDFKSTVPFDLNLLEKLYSNNYFFNDEELVILANQLNFLDSSKSKDILIFMSFSSISLEYLNTDVVDILAELNLKENLELTLIKYGKIDAIIYLSENGLLENLNEDFDYACYKNNIKIAQFLHNKYNLNYRTINKQVILNVNRPEIAKWLISLQNFDISYNNYYLCIYLSKNSNIELLKYISGLHDFPYQKIMTRARLSLETFVWLFESFHNYTELEIKRAFINACENDNLRLARHIYDISKLEINIQKVLKYLENKNISENIKDWLDFVGI